MTKFDEGCHQFTLDDETYYALLRLTEAAATPCLADAYLKELILRIDAEERPPKGILEKIRDGEPV